MQSISLINMIEGNRKPAELTVHLFFQNMSTHLITFAKSSLPWKTELFVWMGRIPCTCQILN